MTTPDHTNLVLPEYTTFVAGLFKTDLPGNGAAFLHAAVGISGEVAELLDARDPDNMLEECSDLEFYIEAAWQALHVEDSNLSRIPACELDGVVLQAYHRLVYYAGKVLDLAKKVWVYNKTVPADLKMLALSDFEDVLCEFYRLRGWSRESIIRHNMEKLRKRYPTGTYSDSHAIARADKPAGE